MEGKQRREEGVGEKSEKERVTEKKVKGKKKQREVGRK